MNTPKEIGEEVALSYPSDAGPPKLQVGQRWKTRAGQRARVICVDRHFPGGRNPVVILVLKPKWGGHEVARFVDADGYQHDKNSPTEYDLIERLS